MDPETLDVLRTSNEEGICSAAWHPTRSWVACGKRSGQICLLDSETMKVQRRFEAHLGDVNSIAWSPDGEFLASGSADQSVKVYDRIRIRLTTRLN